jgi:hypothetical protein
MEGLAITTLQPSLFHIYGTSTITTHSSNIQKEILIVSYSHDVVMQSDNELEAMRSLFDAEIAKAIEASSVEDINMSGFNMNVLLDRFESELRTKGKALRQINEE